MVVLIVGANGQLGARCCTLLLERGVKVRGSVRVMDRGKGLAELGVDIVELDVASGRGTDEALAGVESLVVTANPVAPRRGDDPAAFDEGLHRLLDAAAAAGVHRVVVVSVPESPIDEASAVFRSKRELERQMRAAAYEHVVLRFPAFMESWLALVGSSVPLRGEQYATLARPSAFLQAFRRATGTLVEKRGLMLVPGSKSHRNAFISVDDVAHACAEAVQRDDLANRTFEVGGPEVLTWADVAETYSRVLGRPVRMLVTPAQVYALVATVLGPVAKVPAATMSLNRVMAVSETPWIAGGGLLEPAGMATVTEFLTKKARLPAT